MKSKVFLSVLVVLTAFALPFLLLPGAESEPSEPEPMESTEPTAAESTQAPEPETSFDGGLILRCTTILWGLCWRRCPRILHRRR